ncbi:transcriptional regulator PadR family protein [Natrinema altunense JCM 12890]|uniref:Transcriptional regulator PadR family protein n=1 Tax=Natrinema altunense (strain JCM 12890 / CGMCC 1.3731 / AJ2) TaxID=1227494 RepID=L9ZK79_NATA2|nr:transcriptional regulator PadR family protein [Natrinema altunense JCM 12890]
MITGRDGPQDPSIKGELEEYYENEIHPGRLYPNLDTVIDKGLVYKGEADKRTNHYTITMRGQHEFEATVEQEVQAKVDANHPDGIVDTDDERIHGATLEQEERIRAREDELERISAVRSGYRSKRRSRPRNHGPNRPRLRTALHARRGQLSPTV